MAKIGVLPGKAIVDAFRGTLDYYAWCNLNIVRSWPRSPGRNRSAAVVASQQPFIYINKLASTLPANVIEPYKTMASDSGLSWKDYLNRLYINASTRDHMYPAEVTQEDDMNIIWKDVPATALDLSNQNADIPWTDLDLTAHTSAEAQFAIIHAILTAVTPGTSLSTYLFLRKKGTPATKPYLIIVSTYPSWATCTDTLTLALDTNQTIQYRLVLATGAANISITLAILGYIE